MSASFPTLTDSLAVKCIKGTYGFCSGEITFSAWMRKRGMSDCVSPLWLLRAPPPPPQYGVWLCRFSHCLWCRWRPPRPWAARSGCTHCHTTGRRSAGEEETRSWAESPSKFCPGWFDDHSGYYGDMVAGSVCVCGGGGGGSKHTALLSTKLHLVYRFTILFVLIKNKLIIISLHHMSHCDQVTVSQLYH